MENDGAGAQKFCCLLYKFLGALFKISLLFPVTCSFFFFYFYFFFPFSAHLTHFFIPPLGSSFVVSEGSYLDISDWLNPAKLSLYYQINATSPWVRDLCGQRTTDACEQLCDQETGKGGLGRAKTLLRLER